MKWGIAAVRCLKQFCKGLLLPICYSYISFFFHFLIIVSLWGKWHLHSYFKNSKGKVLRKTRKEKLWWEIGVEEGLHRASADIYVYGKRARRSAYYFTLFASYYVRLLFQHLLIKVAWCHDKGKCCQFFDLLSCLCPSSLLLPLTTRPVTTRCHLDKGKKSLSPFI